MKRLIIEQLNEGFIFISEDGGKYALSESMLSIRVKAYFGLTKVKPKKKNSIAPPAKVSEATKPETQGNKTADSHSAGAIPITKRGDPEEAGEEENTHRYEDISQSSSTEHAQKQPAGGHIPKVEKTKLGTPDNYIIMKPSGLKIPKFGYDKSKMQPYEKIFFQEFPDEAVVLEYVGSHYYTTKENVLKIPYPFPEKYFSKENGWSSNIEIAFKKYRKYLAEQEMKKEIQVVQNQKQDDDWKYHPMLKKDTKGNHGEDYEKIEGSLEM